MTISTSFLKEFQLPPRLVRELPSTRFDDGLAEWERTRQHELESPLSASYGYYAHSFQEHTRYAWKQHDDAIRAHEAELSGSAWGSTFEDLGSDPGFALGAVARQLGWRIVPLARKAAHYLRDPSIAHKVEAACREWCESADAVWKLIARVPDTRANLEAARLMVRPLRDEARKLAERVSAEFQIYSDKI